MTRPARAVLALGAVVGVLGALLAGPSASSPWRAVVLPLALGAVLAGIVELLALARAEWRRERPASRRYLTVATLFIAAFLLTVVATT
jgi:uncharacterized membrane protein YozB (DUF420 family)